MAFVAVLREVAVVPEAVVPAAVVELLAVAPKSYPRPTYQCPCCAYQEQSAAVAYLPSSSFLG